MPQEIIQIQVSAVSDKLKTEEAICFIKEKFSKKLARNLNLIKVSAPIAVLDGTGINDDLNGIEKPVSFPVKGLNGKRASVVQSLAKWKRLRLKEFNIEAGKGILTDMRALRPDEDLSPIHSIYVDQWDWEKRIIPEQRGLFYLKATVESIYEALKSTEKDLAWTHRSLSSSCRCWAAHQCRPATALSAGAYPGDVQAPFFHGAGDGIGDSGRP